MSMESTLDQIAQIIEPEAMRKYKADLGAAPTWDQLVAFSTVKIARQKAEAIIALLLPAPVCTEDDGSYDPVYRAQLSDGAIYAAVSRRDMSDAERRELDDAVASALSLEDRK